MTIINLAHAIARMVDSAPSYKTGHLRRRRIELLIGTSFETTSGHFDRSAAEAVAALVDAHEGSEATRDGYRDAVRALIRAMVDIGQMSEAMRDDCLDCFRHVRPLDRKPPALVSPQRIRQIFAELELDRSLRARRDAAIIGLIAGAGVRIGEVVWLEGEDVVGSILLTADGINVLPAISAILLEEWMTVRGRGSGPLFPALGAAAVVALEAAGGRTHPVELDRLTVRGATAVVRRRCGQDVSLPAMRRLAHEALVASGFDVQTASSMIGQTCVPLRRSFMRV